ncbi:DUF2141 domain-containing protein [Azospirillum sp. sgz302134]
MLRCPLPNPPPLRRGGNQSPSPAIAGEGRGGGIGAAVFLLTILLTTPTHAADLSVTVTNVRNDRGKVLVALCTPDTFLKAGCPYTAGEPARAGQVTVTVRNVPPGTYAVQAFHDENQNLDIDRNFLGLPEEGIGFGNDAPMRFGPPRYADAALAIGPAGGRTNLALRYFIESGSGSSSR